MSSAVNNQNLKDDLELLAKKAFALYKSVINHYPVANDPFQTVAIIVQLEAELKQIDEFQTCVDIMNADETISPLLGKMVGTIVRRSTTESADTCVTRFIERLYHASQDKAFDSAFFHDQYEAFEELFYSDQLRFLDTVRLHNFDSEVDEIGLEDGLAIKKLPLIQDDRTTIEEAEYRPHVQFSRSDFVMERRYIKPKLVGNSTTKPSPEQLTKELNESDNVFDLVITALRILKPSAVYRDHSITTKTLTFLPYGGGGSRTPLVESILLGNKCVVSSEEAAELKTLYTKMKQAKHQPFTIASNRLGFGMERRSDEDRLLDYMIGLESLYLPDGNDELTFRLSLRVAFVTRQEMAERKHMFKFIRKMYGVRSNIAHGGKKYELTKEDISQIEEVLRQSLKIFLDKPANFSKETLDNIYFEG